ncbi:MAG: 50S ribosomal protein P1 [Candidatus Aenigmarchaeota archaeon]|nr:50S ribosomal protein P1 [Candidatus Aenigmarchaeota archaeon]
MTNLIYAGLLLHSAGKPVDEEHVKKIANAVGGVDEAQIKAFVTAIKDVNIDDAISKAAMPVAAAPVAAAPVAAEEKKEGKEDVEKKAEEAAEGLGALFG